MFFRVEKNESEVVYEEKGEGVDEVQRHRR